MQGVPSHSYIVSAGTKHGAWGEASERLGIARNGQILSSPFRQCTLISPCHSGLAISATGGLTPPDNSKHCVSSSLADCTGNIHQLRRDIWRMDSVGGRCDVPLAYTPISCYTFTVSSPSFCQGWKESVAGETLQYFIGLSWVTWPRWLKTLINILFFSKPNMPVWEG